MLSESKTLLFRSVPVLGLLLVTQAISGCVSTNAPDPTVVTAQIAKTEAPTIAPVVPIVPPEGSNEPVFITATATITASGIYAKSNGIAVFASIGEVGSPSIQRNAHLSKVSGVGSLAFTGTSGDLEQP